MQLVAEQRSRPLARLLGSPAPWGALLAVVAVNVGTVRPVGGIDSSFRVGLTEAVLKGMNFGDDVVWPYGPLGFLAGPTSISRPLLALALLWQFVVLAALFTALLHHLGRLGLARVWSVLVLAPVALAISLTENMVAEVGSLAVVVILVVLWQDDRPSVPAPSTWWVVAIAGFVSGAQILVKIGPGGLACIVVVGFAVSGGERLRQGAVAVGAIVLGFLACWFVTGQSVSALGPFITTGLDASSGYQEAQAANPMGQKVKLVGLLALLAAVIAAVGAVRWAVKDRSALWAVIPLGLATWFFLKQGLVRWDEWHAASALILVALIASAMPWDRRWLAVPIGVLLVAAVGALLIAPSRLRSTWEERMDTALVLVSSQQQADQILSAKEAIRADYDVPPSVIEALSSGTVHVEPWDINAAWANDLDWNPLPVLQSYAAYTEELDRINADHYASADGPDGVLLSDVTVDNRYDLWESPQARLALTCNFEVSVTSGDWYALRRAPDTCGEGRELEVASVAPGEALDVPEASDPNSIVVAHFELPSDRVGWLVSTVARPLRFPTVTLDGDTTFRLVPGHAENAHIVRSPGEVGGRELPHGPIDHDTISFSNLGSGDVVVRFEEIPLGSG